MATGDEWDLKRTIKTSFMVFIGIMLIILVLSVVFGSWYSVGEGEVGVMFQKFGAGQGFNPVEKQQGWGFKVPFRDRIIVIPFRTQQIGFYGGTEQRGTYGAITPMDKNGMPFTVDLTVRYRLDPTQASEFVEQKGEGIVAMEGILATSARADSTRGVFGQYAQEDVPAQRTTLATEIMKILQERIDQEASGKLKKGFITVEAVDIRNVVFDARIADAIVNKQTQKQVAERKEYELQQAKKEKEIAIVQAERDKQAAILRAEGEGQATFIVAEAKARGIRLINDAYQKMPSAYVATKFAEAIKPTDKVYLGFDSLGGGQLNFLNLNDLAGLKASGATSTTTQ